MSVIIASSAIALAANPSVGKNPGQIVFDDKTGTSDTFKVWNKGTGTLNYTVAVSAGSKYFKVTPTKGQSRGTGEARTHTVTADFNTIPHGTTVTGRIKITNASDVNSPQYIDLTAHDTIARHVQFISIEQGIDYIPGASDANATTGNCDGLGLAGDFDCDGFVDFSDLAVLTTEWLQTGSDVRADISPDNKNGTVDFKDLAAFGKNWNKDGRIGETYDFRFTIQADSTVTDVNFITPAGVTYPASNQDASRHITMSRTKVNGVNDWRYQEWFYDANGLDNYPDGKYIVKVTYADHNSSETIVNFGIPKQAGSIAQPTQRPEITYPLSTADAVSPLQFTWAKNTDSNVEGIQLGFRNSRDSNTTEQYYGKGAVKADSSKLTPGRSFAELSFGRWYQVQNVNDITIEVGKASRSHVAFDITKGFGTFGGLKNHQLEVNDCQGKMVTFSLTGGGEGVVEGDSNVPGDCSFAKVTLSGTTQNSVLTITPQPGARTSVVNIESAGPIKTINARNVNLKGDILIDGSAGMIVLNDVSGSSNIKLGPSASSKTASALKLGRVNKLTLTSGTPIKELRATEWKSGSVNAPWISNLAIDGNAAGKIAGDFGANVTLSGTGSPKGISLKKVKVAGQLGNAKWNVAGSCGIIEAGSSSKYFDANITGSIGTLRTIGNKAMATGSTLSGTWQVKSVNTIKATDISNCNLAASQGSTGKIAAIGKVTAGRLMDSDFAAVNGLLKQLNVTGVVGEPFGVVNSSVKAGHLGTAYLAFPKYSNNGTSFGLTAGKIDKVTIKDPAKTTTWRNLQVGAEALTTDDFEIRLE